MFSKLNKIAAVCFATILPSGATLAEPQCNGSGEVVADCFWVYGSYNVGASKVYLSPGDDPPHGSYVVDGDYEPPIITEILDKDFHVYIVGDFEACPFKDRVATNGTHIEHVVCVEAAKVRAVIPFTEQDRLCELVTCRKAE